MLAVGLNMQFDLARSKPRPDQQPWPTHTVIEVGQQHVSHAATFHALPRALARARRGASLLLTCVLGVHACKCASDVNVRASGSLNDYRDHV